jgi:fused signal recognition particle receptor
VGTVEFVVVGVAAVTVLWAMSLPIVCYVIWRDPRADHTADATVRRATDVRAGLAATRRRLGSLLADAFGRAEREVFDGLEEALIAADVGVRTAQSLLAKVRARMGEAMEPTELRQALRVEILAALATGPGTALTRPGPHVILVTGVNGVGKTTTVGKLAARYQTQGHRVLLVAADTFRAAAIEQLQAWGERLGVPVVAGTAGSSPAAAAFEGMRAARTTGVDVVLVDTAGRLHTRKPLVDELRKVRRVVAEGVVGAPHETLLVLDATTGQNALSQARAFTEAVDVTGVVITKLDGTARGGMALAVAQELGLRISDVGVGEGLADLRPFSPEEFVAGLLDDEECTGAT